MFTTTATPLQVATVVQSVRTLVEDALDTWPGPTRDADVNDIATHALSVLFPVPTSGVQRAEVPADILATCAKACVATADLTGTGTPKIETIKRTRQMVYDLGYVSGLKVAKEACDAEWARLGR